MTPSIPSTGTEITINRRTVDTDTDQTTAAATEREILKQRALELAREPADATPAADTLEVIEFELSGERYAFELAQVREVCALRELTPVPCTPEFLTGIVNLRGEILAVIDLRKFFGLPSAGITQLNQIIIIEGSATRLGILVDSVERSRTILPGSLQPALPTHTDVRADYLRGITGDRLAVLDAAKILSHPRILIEDRDDT